MSPKRTRIFAMVVAIILVLAMLVGLVISAVAPRAAAAGPSLDSLRKNAKVLAEKKKDIQSELSQIKKDKASAAKRKVALDKQIEVTSEEIDNTTGLISELTSEIALRQHDLDAAIQREALQYEEFMTRIRLMEEAGDTQYLGVLLEADSFSDLLGRITTVQEIMDYDQNLLKELKETKDKIETDKRQLEQDKQEQTAVKKELAGRQAELVEQNAEQMKFIKELESEENDYRAAYEEQQKAEKNVQDQIKKLLDDLKKQEKSKVFVGGKYQFPCPGYSRVSSEFGMRFHPILKENRGHKGIDLAAPSGTKVFAANGGTVIKAGYNSGGYGNYIVIDHGGGQATLYGHLSRILISDNQKVGRGDLIGLVGSTGLSTGPHLHFEVLLNGTPVNPRGYIKVP